MKLTNVSSVEAFLPSGSPDIWSYEVDLRDVRGTPVPRTSEWMRAISERPTAVTLNVSIPLAAGASLTKTVILDKLFDLHKPGQYTVRLSFDSFACGNSGTRVTSKLINFAVGAPSTQPSGSKSEISVTANAPRTKLPVGWAVPLDIVIQNKSTHPVRWAVDDPPNTAPDEFLTGAEIFDLAGQVRRPPAQPNPNWSFSRFRYAVSILEIPSGKSAEQIALLGDLFDISESGSYSVKVALWDPVSHRRVESKPVSFEIVENEHSIPALRQPPFLVTISSANFSPPNPANILICMGNISDHDIRLDNSAGKDFVAVEDLDGHPATLTVAAQEARKRVDLTKTLAGVEQYSTWYTVRPRRALCGGLPVSGIYDLSKPDAYRVRIDRHDEINAIPGQTVGELPLVHSNWLTILEP